MKKTPEERREERLQEIADLMKKRDEINARLNFLTGVTETANVKPEENPLPVGFSITKEVLDLFQEHPKLYIKQATTLMEKKFPQYKIDRRKVHGSLTYLAERGKIKKEAGERGLFARVDGA